MARSGFNASELKKLQKELENLKEGAEPFLKGCTKEIAGRVLDKAVSRTPVGDYSTEVTVTAKWDSENHKKGESYIKRVNLSGKVGGTLRRNWKVSPYSRTAGGGKITVYNDTEYASYVENGHRQTPGRYVPALGKRLKKSFVKGKFMLESSRREVEAITPQLIEKRVYDYLGKGLK